MKLTTILLFAGFLQVSATAYSQKINLSEKNAPLNKVLDQIRQQSGYSLFYDKDLISKAPAVDVQVSNASVEQSLDAVLKDQQLTWSIVDKTIVIKPKEESFLDKLKDKVKAEFAQVTVTAKVYDELGQPMPGVNVRIKGTQNGTTTDSKGNFSINVPDDKAVLIFSFIGYETQELQAKDIPGGSVITLKVAENNLQEVVIKKGYYDEKRALSTGDVSVVSAKTIEEQPVFDPIQALISRVPGLNIQQASGIPGAYASVNIRGANSIFNGNDPLYIVDGVPFTSIPLSSNGVNTAVGVVLNNAIANNVGKGTGSGGGISPFSAINPDDIEDIQVLKDADATSIYGSKGANGVILITTKKGNAGATQVHFDLSEGIGQVGHFMDLLNTQQYLQAFHQAFANDGLPFPSISSNPSDFWYNVDGLWDTTRYTNWQKTLIGGTAHYTNAQMSISGGNVNTQFLIGGAYVGQTTVFPGDFNDKKGSLHFSINHTSSNQRFQVQLTGSYVNDNDVLPPADYTSDLGSLPPTAPALYNRDGSINWDMYQGSASFFDNPAVNTLQSSTAVTNNLVSNLNLSYKILPGLTISADFGFNHDEMNQTQLNPSTAVQPPFNLNPLGRSSLLATTTNQGWIIKPLLNYQQKIARGQLNLLLGGDWEQMISQSISANAYGFASDALLDDQQAATNYTLTGDAYNLYRYEALITRAAYSWEDKYLLNMTFNRDGSTRFGLGKQFGNFGAMGAGWIFSKESLVQNNLPWLSFGKLRASYGTSGNDQIGNYRYLATYTPNSTLYEGLNGLKPTLPANPNFSWETDRKLEIGLDMGFLKDQVNLSVDYYQNRTGNQLVQETIPAIAGSGSGIEINIPADVQNNGWELQMNTTNIKNKEFSWSSSLNFTAPQNKLLSFEGLSSSTYKNQYVIGQSIYSAREYQYAGVNPQTGLYTFRTQNSNGQPSFPQDAYPSVPITQKYYGGLGNDFSYKGFSLNIFFQFVKQIEYSYQRYFYPPGDGNEDVPIQELAGWTTPGQITNVQKFSTGGAAANAYSNFTSSNGVLVDGSFIRLQNVALSYRLPDQWQHWAAMKNARVYLNGQNLYTFTKYIGLDPSTSGLVLPPLRTIMLGVSTNF